MHFINIFNYIIDQFLWLTTDGLIFQISLAYCLIVLSLLNLAEFTALRILLLVQTY